MAIPYGTVNFKSTNILAIVNLGSTAKFNYRQYFRLYGISLFLAEEPHFHSHHAGTGMLLYTYNTVYTM